MLPFSLKVLRFGKLFPKLYLSAEGLTKICQFLCKVSSVFTSRCAFGDLSLLMTERVFPSLFLQGVAKPSSLETLSPIQVSEGDIQRSQFSTLVNEFVFNGLYTVLSSPYFLPWSKFEDSAISVPDKLSTRGTVSGDGSGPVLLSELFRSAASCIEQYGDELVESFGSEALFTLTDSLNSVRVQLTE